MAVDEISRRLKEISNRSAVSLIIDINNYFTAMKEVVKHTEDEGIACVYITSTIPSTVIKEQLASEGLSAEHVLFIDCISYMVGSTPTISDKVIYIESPTMLESIMLKVDMWLKKLKEGRKAVLLDSVSALAMHNDRNLLSEFLHYFVNHIRGKNIQTIILSIAEQTPEELETVLRLVCDETLILKGEEQSLDK